MKPLSRAAAALAGVGLLMMAFLGVADIIGTQFLGRPVPGTVEITRGLMVFCIMLGLAHAEAQGKHIRVEIGVEHLPPRARRYFNVLAPLGMAILFALIAGFGWDALWKSVATGEYDEGSIALPLWPARLALAVGATMMAAQSVLRIREVWRAGPDETAERPLAPL